MSATDSVALRGFVERLLGWSDGRPVELAIRSLEIAADHRAALVLYGTGDMVPIARGLHRRALGVDRPFVVCDPRRGNRSASVRSPANRASGTAAMEVAAGGSLCVRMRRLPRDFPALATQLRVTDDVLFIVCAEQDDANPLLVRPAPVRVSPLAERASELPRVIDEYALDAIADLGVQTGFTKHDHEWVRERASRSLAEIEAATLRLVAIREMRSPSAAATRLGMAPVSLLKWFERRNLHVSRQ